MEIYYGEREIATPFVPSVPAKFVYALPAEEAALAFRLVIPAGSGGLRISTITLQAKLDPFSAMNR